MSSAHSSPRHVLATGAVDRTVSRPQRLSGVALQRLSRLSSVRGCLDAAIPWAVIGTSAWAACTLGTWYAALAALVIIASRQAALANLSHDAWHRLCFRSRRVNDGVGAWLYAYPVGVPFFHDRRRHFAHHRLVGQLNDPDWVNYTNEGRDTAPRLIRYLLGRLAGTLLFETAWSVLVTRKPRIVIEGADAKDDGPAHEMLRVVICQVVLLVVFTLCFGRWGYFFFWLLPIATLTAFCNNLRALVEHVAEDPQAAPEARLRDIDASLLERVFFSPAHFHFHALHHGHPSIPHYRLSAAKSALTELSGDYPYPVAQGYIRTLREHLLALGRKRGAP
jgi:fatty acid desaturase